MADVGTRQNSQKVGGHRADPIQRDDIQPEGIGKGGPGRVGELLPSNPGDRVSRRRIENRIRGRQGTKITNPKIVVRNGGGQRGSLASAGKLVVAKQKHLVFLYRSTQAKTALVVVEGRHTKAFSLRAGSGYLFCEGVRGEGSFVPIEPEKGAVEIVGPGLRHILGDHTRRAAVLRVVGGGGDLHFLHRFRVGSYHLEAAETVSRVIDPVDLVVAVAEELPIHQRGIKFRGVFAGADLEEVFDNSGHQRIELRDIPIGDRKGLNPPRTDDFSDIGFLCLEHWRGRCNCHLLCDSSQIQSHVHRRFRVDVEQNVLLQEALKPRGLDTKRINSRREISDQIQSGSFSGPLGLHLRSRIRSCDRCIRDCGPAGISDVARNCSRDGLPENTRCRQQSDCCRRN